MRRALFAAVLLAAAACAPPQPDSEIGGPYRLAAALGAQGGKILCRRTGASCALRIPAAVACYGADEDYVVAGVRVPGKPDELRYYYLVRLFDHPEADGHACLADAAAAAPPWDDAGAVSGGEARDLASCGRRKVAVAPEAPAGDEAAGAKDDEAEARGDAGCAVRGPFTLKEFDNQRRRHCVPAKLDSDKVKCMPDATTPA